MCACAWKVEKLIKVDGLVMESGGEVMVGGIRGGTRGQGGVVVDMYPRSTISAVLCTSWGVMKILVLLINSDPKCPPNPTTAPEYQQKACCQDLYQVPAFSGEVRIGE